MIAESFDGSCMKPGEPVPDPISYMAEMRSLAGACECQSPTSEDGRYCLRCRRAVV
jgi:hypothetical protein